MGEGDLLPSWLGWGAPQGCHTLGRKPGAVMDAAEALRGLPGSSGRLQARWSAGKGGLVDQGASRNHPGAWHRSCHLSELLSLSGC